MVHSCNPSYLESIDWEDRDSRLTQAKSKIPISPNKLGMV
jgi:hypothetical protein